jgi:hypothetical protein
MTPFILKNLLRNNILLMAILLLPATSLHAQSADTVVVYEYVYVNDTIWIEPKPDRDTVVQQQLQPIEDATLLINTDSRKADLMIFSSKRNATIPINRIILSENNKKQTGMKKLTLLGFTFLAMNSSLFAQSKPEKDIGIYLRGNLEIQTSLAHGTNSVTGWHSFSELYRFTPAVGVRGNFPISQFFSLSPRISFTRISGSYKVNNNEEGTYWGTMFYFLSTDLLINYYILKAENKKVRIYGGLRADCLVKQKKGIDLTDSDYSNFNSMIFNYVGGFGIDFGKRVYAEFEYSNNINRFIDNENMQLKYSAVSINVGYNLF